MSKRKGERTEAQLEQAALAEEIRTLYLKRRKLELEAEVWALELEAECRGGVRPPSNGITRKGTEK